MSILNSNKYNSLFVKNKKKVHLRLNNNFNFIIDGKITHIKLVLWRRYMINDYKDDKVVDSLYLRDIHCELGCFQI